MSDSSLSLALPLPLSSTILSSDEPLSGSKSHSHIDSEYGNPALGQPPSATRNLSIQPVGASQIQISANGSGSESDSSQHEEKNNLLEDSVQEINHNEDLNDEKKEIPLNASSNINAPLDGSGSHGSKAVTIVNKSRSPVTGSQVAPSPHQGPPRVPFNGKSNQEINEKNAEVAVELTALSVPETPELSFVSELCREAPLNGIREAIKLNRVDFIKRIVEGFQSGKLNQTSLLKTAVIEETKTKDEKAPSESIVKAPLSLRLLLSPDQKTLQEEIRAFQFIQQQKQNAVQKGKKTKKDKDEEKRDNERDAKREQNRSIEQSREDSNIHVAVRTAAKFHSLDVLQYLLQQLYPQGLQAVAVDLENLDNSLAISIDQNSPIESLNKLGSSPLNAAVADVKVPIEAVKLLLEYGADMQSRTLIGNQALHIASYIGNIAAVEVLLSRASAAVRNAMINDTNLAGLSPLDYARTKQVKALLEQAKIANQVASQGQGKDSAAVSRSTSFRHDGMGSAATSPTIGSKRIGN
jgi:hypothetical protein